jgi:glutaminyl-tRNA synthetase
MYEHLMEEVTKVRSDEVTKGEDAGARVLSRPPDWLSSLNPDSLQVLTGCKLEPNWRDAAEKGDFDDGVLRVQFERQGYFCLDKSAAEVGRREGGKAGALVFNRTLSLRDSWAKSAKTE